MVKNAWKRVLAFVLAIAMVVCDAGVSNMTYAAETEEEENSISVASEEVVATGTESTEDDSSDASADDEYSAEDYLIEQLESAFDFGVASVDIKEEYAVTPELLDEVYEDLLTYNYKYFYVEESKSYSGNDYDADGFIDVVTSVYITYGLEDGLFGSVAETDENGDYVRDENDKIVYTYVDLSEAQMENIHSMQDEIEDAIQSIVDGANKNWCDVEKALYLNDYLAQNCQYDQYSYDLAENGGTADNRLTFTIYGALIENLCVCQGYAKAFVILARALGLEAETVTSSSINHEWNAVKIDGNWYMLDVTWNDPIKGEHQSDDADNQLNDTIGKASHTYFLKSMDYFLEKHGGDEAHKSEKVDDEDSNYSYSGELTDASFTETTYDSGYIWDDVDTPFVYDSEYGEWYALVAEECTKDGGLTAEDVVGEIYNVTFKMDNTTLTIETELLETISDVWYANEEAGTAYKVGYYCLQLYNGILYYSTSKAIYGYQTSTGSTYYYGLTDSQLDIGVIYGMRIVDNGTMYIQLSQSADSVGKKIELLDVNEARLSVEDDEAEITLESYTYTYDGYDKTPGVIVTYGNDTLDEGSDYRIAYSDNKDAGTAEVTVTGIGKYNGSAAVKFTIKQADVTYGDFADLTMTYGRSVYYTDEKGNIVKSAYDYSGDESVATISDGIISAVGVGTTYIYYYIGDEDGSNYSYTAFKVTVSKASQSITGVGNISLQYSLSKTLSPVATGGGTISYSSSNTSVATVSSSGKITTVGVGTTTITITAAATANYNSTSTSITVTVTQAPQSVSVSTKGSSTLYVGGTTTWKATSTSGGSITYSSGDSSIATISSSGVVTAKKVGIVTLYATANSTTNYSASSKTQLAIIYVAPAATSSVSVSNTSTGIKVSWSQVTGASGYYVSRSTSSNGTYEYIAQITSGSTLEYTNTGVKSGTTYYYKVTAYYSSTAGTLLGKESSVKSIKFLSQAAISSLTNANTGVTIKWSQVTGASGYYIYRGSTLIKTVTSGSTVSYTDTKATAGSSNSYYVQAYSGSTKGVKSSKKSIKYLKRGSISSVANAAKGVTVKWSEVSGASGYYIYRGSTAIKKITSGSTTSWTDTSVASGTKYTYYVVPYSGSTYGAKSAGKSIRFVARATISSVENVSSGVTVTWSKVSKAKGYYIYRGSSKIATVSSSKTSYTDTKVKSKNGSSYTYYVVAYYGDYKAVKSAGVKIVRLTAPSISSVKNSASKKITVKYSQNSKATGYYIEYSTSKKFTTSTTKKVKITSNSTVSKTISKLTKNKTYYVRVRAYKTSGGKTYYSAYSSTKSVKIKK